MQIIHHSLKSNNKNRVGYALTEVKYTRIFSDIIKDNQPSIANDISMMPKPFLPKMSIILCLQANSQSNRILANPIDNS